jgi:CHAD domain-containing protein
VQSALGDYQDSVVARDRLRQVGIAAHLDGLNAFTFGRLHALEEQRAERALAAGALALERLPRRGKRWLRA